MVGKEKESKGLSEVELFSNSDLQAFHVLNGANRKTINIKGLFQWGSVMQMLIAAHPIAL